MVKLVRSWSAGVIALLVLSLSTVEMPHMGGAHHDPDCDIIVVAHDASAHRVDGDGPDQGSQTQHCLACHWGRSFRPEVDSDGLRAPFIETTPALVFDQPSASKRVPISRPSLRAPPA